MKWPNVFVNVSAWLPKYFSPALQSFMKTRLAIDKIIFGSNGLPWKRYLDQFDELGLSEEAKRKMLYENAKKVHRL
jgi:predicted TIM-barrel fold metal-dependent hydrolase